MLWSQNFGRKGREPYGRKQIMRTKTNIFKNHMNQIEVYGNICEIENDEIGKNDLNAL